VRLLGVGLDVTEHIESAQRLTRLVESAEAATKAKAEFLATMSHEIRTPMNGVIGMTNLLIATELDDTQREYVETIRSCGEALLSLLNDILDFSKMEAGKLVLERAPFSLERVVLDCLTLFTSQAEQNGVALLHSLPTVQLEVLGDSVRTRQILLNLISNALKFTRHGHVRVDVETRKVSSTKIVAQLRISDTGIGMAPEHLTRLGEAFHQADASTTRRFGGTGLGLTICKTLVHLMDGELRVESTLGMGTTFEVNLPLEVAQLPEVVVDNPHSGPSTARQFRRVLVAEDNVVNQRVVSLMLKPFATEVVIANDGVQAVAAFKSESFDCILMDGQMPNLDGIAATREIRLWERQQGLSRIPIIALTANAFAGDRETFIEAGADEYLTKPVRTNDLKGVITRVLRRR
jgi:CheY-like chemotaxis protein/nitrogen-specific signal transduction histidine kinase